MKINKIAIVGHGIVPSILSGQASKEIVNKYEENKGILELADDLMYDKPTKKQMNQVIIPVRTEPKYQRNEPCPCGSGLKYKKCCKK
jgi:uncharacterized protein YecA (UPF0149 family)